MNKSVARNVIVTAVLATALFIAANVSRLDEPKRTATIKSKSANSQASSYKPDVSKSADSTDNNLSKTAPIPHPTNEDEIPVVASHADESDAAGIAVWISDVFMRERPYIGKTQILTIDSEPILQDQDKIRLQLLSDETLLVTKFMSLELPIGGMKWAGRIDGMEDSTVNIEVSAIGETIIRVSTLSGRIYVRPSPMLPFHVAYTKSADYYNEEEVTQ